MTHHKTRSDHDLAAAAERVEKGQGARYGAPDERALADRDSAEFTVGLKVADPAGDEQSAVLAAVDAVKEHLGSRLADLRVEGPDGVLVAWSDEAGAGVVNQARDEQVFDAEQRTAREHGHDRFRHSVTGQWHDAESGDETDAPETDDDDQA